MKYIIEKETGIPCCPVCGQPIPDCAPGAINIDPCFVNYCYFCGAHMERFYYPEEKTNES